MNEGLKFESTPKAISVERMGGSLSVELSDGLKEGAIFEAASVAKAVIGEDGLYEIIVPEEGTSFEIRPYNQDAVVPDELKKEIEEGLAKVEGFF